MVVAVAILLGVIVSLGVPEWERGAVAIGMDAIGAAVTGMDAIGMAVTGAVAIGTAIGTVITVTITLFSSATSAFPAGGVGVGAGILSGGNPFFATPSVSTASAIEI